LAEAVRFRRLVKPRVSRRSRDCRGRRRCVPAAASYVRAAPQGNCSADTGAVGLALNPLPRMRFPAGDQIRLDGATTTRPAACGDPVSQPADTSLCGRIVGVRKI
jgi:hypothetical protein